MATIGNLILRLVVVTIGYMIACAAAGAFITFGFFSEVFISLFSDMRDLEGAQALQTGSMIVAASSLSFVVAYFAFLPSLVTIAIAEAMRWHGLVSNLLMGGFIAFVVGELQIPREELSSTSEGTLIVLLATGFISGFFYWAISGHRAGKWLGEPKSTTEPAQ